MEYDYFSNDYMVTMQRKLPKKKEHFAHNAFNKLTIRAQDGGDKQ